ncbi:MAG: potassium-transporting ATPase subunit C, partial [Brevinematia bacterium]
MKELMRTIKIYFFLFILVGLLYPFTITFLSQVLFKDKANGSIIYKDGVPVGST